MRPMQKVTRWHLVNLESEPLAKLRAFKGTLFKVPCEACGKTMQFHYPCVFLDETHRALLYLCPEEVEQDTQTLSALPPQEGYKLRLVRTPEELAEARRAIASTLSKCEKALEKLRPGSSAHTLTVRRIRAFRIALELIDREMEQAKDSTDEEERP